MDGIENNEETVEMEITIGGPIASKIIDTCVGTDNRRYYRIQWEPSWESEEDVVVRHQTLVEAYWQEEQEKSETSAIVDLVLDKAVTEQNIAANNVAITNFIPVNVPEKVNPPPLIPHSRAGVEHKFKCDECPRSYPTERKLKDHKRKLHVDRGSFKCSVCPKVFASKRGAQEHINRHTGLGPHVCPGCNKRYITVNDLQHHKKICQILVQKDFQCKICQKYFATKAHLTFHMKIHVPNEQKQFACKYCPRRFAYNHDCVHHMRLHIGEKPFKCSQCDAAFHRKSYLTEHMFVHTGVSRYRCNECGMYVKTQQMLKTHVKNVHILKKTRNDKENTAAEDDKQTKQQRREKRNHNRKNKRYKCPECRKDFRFMKELHYHQALNHKDKLKAEEKIQFSDFEPTMVYKCKKCEKSFPHPASLRKHSETHKLLEIPPPGQTSPQRVGTEISTGDVNSCTPTVSGELNQLSGEKPMENITKNVFSTEDSTNFDKQLSETTMNTPLLRQATIQEKDISNEKQQFHGNSEPIQENKTADNISFSEGVVNLAQFQVNDEKMNTPLNIIRDPGPATILNNPVEIQNGFLKVQVEGEEAHILIPAAFSCNSCDAILTSAKAMTEHLYNVHSVLTADSTLENVQSESSTELQQSDTLEFPDCETNT